MSLDICPENLRARDIYEATGNHHNISPKILLHRLLIRTEQYEIDKKVMREYPLGTIVTVENLYRGARFIRGPVLGYSSATSFNGAGLVVLNSKTGKRRFVSIEDFIFKEVT